MKRRQFVALGAGLPALFLLARHGTAASVELTLTAQPWSYNGSSPGPAIHAREGDRVRILFRNRLAQPSTIHWHGLEVPADQDGGPFDAVAPGADRLYEFTLGPDSAGTYWYHPHVHGYTELQVARGLVGMFIVHARHDPLEGLADVPLVVSGAATLRVNGLAAPRLAIRAGETQRWRVLNATAGRYLRLSLEGREFTLAGTDGGLLVAPVEGVTELLLAPAERVELLVTSREAVGTVLALQALPHGDDAAMGMGTGMGMGGMGMSGTGMGGMRLGRNPGSAMRLLEVETVPGTSATITLPRAFRPIEPLPRAPQASRFVLSGDGMMAPFAINGRLFDMRRVDAESRLGEVQRWEIRNETHMDHPFHVHGTRFQVLSRTLLGRTVREPYLAWKDTVDVPSGETVTIAFRHDHPGLWVYHCHILHHEDEGMMGVLRVS